MVVSVNTARSTSSGHFPSNILQNTDVTVTTPARNLHSGTTNESNRGSPSATASSGRPTVRITLEPGGGLHQTANGVTTKLSLRNNDVSAVADASAAAFDRAIASESTPATPTKDKDKRVLRSQGGATARVNSSLARFFPDYEEVVFAEKKEPGSFTRRFKLEITDTV